MRAVSRSRIGHADRSISTAVRTAAVMQPRQPNKEGRERSRSPARVPGGDATDAFAASQGGVGAGSTSAAVHFGGQGGPSNLAASQIASPSTWPTFAAQAAGLTVERLPRRPLVVHSAFTGLGSHAKVLSELQVPFHDVAGCDPKATARQWLEHNALAPAHLYHTIKELTAGSGVCHCLPAAGAGRSCSAVGADPRFVDLFVAGFCCQPYSQQRRGPLDPTSHPLFHTAAETVQYIRAKQPRTLILENTLGF